MFRLSRLSYRSCYPVLLLLLIATFAVAEEAPKRSRLATEGPKPKPITPPTAAEVQSAINRGVDFLLDDQRPEGRWGSAERTKGLNIYSPVPGAHHAYRAAVTGLAVAALVECEPTLDSDRAARTAKAIEAAQAWMLENTGKVRRAAPDAIYNTWGHSYAMQGYVRLHHRAAGDAALQAKLKVAAQAQADLLDRYSYLNGGWGYYDFVAGTKVPAGSPNSFTTATGLIALYEARDLGVTFPQKKIDKAIKSIKRQLNPDFSYAYGEYLRMMPRMDINRPPAAWAAARRAILVCVCMVTNG